MSESDKLLVERLIEEAPDLYKELCLIGINNQHILLYIAKMVFGEYDKYWGFEYECIMPGYYSVSYHKSKPEQPKEKPKQFALRDIKFDKDTYYKQREEAKTSILEMEHKIDKLGDEYLDTYDDALISEIDRLRAIINNLRNEYYIFR